MKKTIPYIETLIHLTSCIMEIIENEYDKYREDTVLIKLLSDMYVQLIKDQSISMIESDNMDMVLNIIYDYKNFLKEKKKLYSDINANILDHKIEAMSMLIIMIKDMHDEFEIHQQSIIQEPNYPPDEYVINDTTIH